VTRAQPYKRGSDPGYAFLSGVMAGVATSLLLELLVVATFIVLAAGAVALLGGALRDRGERARRLAVLSGFLGGASALFVFGSINTVVACVQTDDFCGDANAGPFVAFSIGLVVAAIVSGLAAIESARRARRGTSPNA
jgi:uncharacterized membrane protein